MPKPGQGNSRRGYNSAARYVGNAPGADLGRGQASVSFYNSYGFFTKRRICCFSLLKSRKVYTPGAMLPMLW